MSAKKPRPLVSGATRSRCPVCGETSYSAAGVHPQCSARQADERLKTRIKRERRLAEEQKATAPAGGATPWQKSCPKCKTLQHVRKAQCVCGHAFATPPRPPTSEGEYT